MKKFLILTTMTVMASMAMTTVTAASASVSSAVSSGAPMIGASVAGTHFGLPTVSENWSGYAVTGKTPFNYVSSTFTVPTVTCNGMKDVYTSDWVGLDGFNDQTVEQDGASGTCTKQSNYKRRLLLRLDRDVPGSDRKGIQSPPRRRDHGVCHLHDGMFNLTVTDVTSGRDHDGLLCMRIVRA